jgi:hypothetical protein
LKFERPTTRNDGSNKQSMKIGNAAGPADGFVQARWTHGRQVRPAPPNQGRETDMSKLSEVAIWVAVMLGAAAPAAAEKTVTFRPAAIPIPKSARPLEGAAGSIAIAVRHGDPAFVAVRARAGGYLYCYAVDDQDRIRQLLAASRKPLVHVAAGEVSVFAASHPDGQRAVACFASNRLLGRHPLDPDGIQGGVDWLRSRFARATGNKFEMGVFPVRYQ